MKVSNVESNIGYVDSELNDMVTENQAPYDIKRCKHKHKWFYELHVHESLQHIQNSKLQNKACITIALDTQCPTLDVCMFLTRSSTRTRKGELTFRQHCKMRQTICIVYAGVYCTVCVVWVCMCMCGCVMYSMHVHPHFYILEAT